MVSGKIEYKEVKVTKPTATIYLDVKELRLLRHIVEEAILAESVNKEIQRNLLDVMRSLVRDLDKIEDEKCTRLHLE